MDRGRIVLQAKAASVVSLILVCMVQAAVAETNRWRDNKKSMFQYIQDGYSLVAMSAYLGNAPPSATIKLSSPFDINNSTPQSWSGTIEPKGNPNANAIGQIFMLQKGASVVRCFELSDDKSFTSECSELIDSK
jgi:hypothetical protein